MNATRMGAIGMFPRKGMVRMMALCTILTCMMMGAQARGGDSYNQDGASYLGTGLATGSAASVDIWAAARKAAGKTTEAVNNVDISIPDGQPGSLRAAIDLANANGEDDVIILGPGTYVIDIPGLDDANTSGDLDLTEIGFMTTIVGAGPDQTIIEGGLRDRVFHALPGTSVTLQGLTITGGSTASGGGGGVLNEGNMYVDNCAIIDNTSVEFGGGLRNTGTGVLSVNDSLTSGNTVTGAGFDGGGIAQTASGLLQVVNCRVIGNHVLGGPTSNGGGIYGIFGSGPIEVWNCLIDGNSADQGGGGLFPSSLQVFIYGSTISNNISRAIAGGGGGLATEGGPVTIINSTISGNKANDAGGGIRNISSLTCQNVTIVDNAADYDDDGSGEGGGLAALGNTQIIGNTIIAFNWDLGGEYPDILDQDCLIDSLGYNLVGDVGQSDFCNNTTGDQYGDPNGTTAPDAGAFESASAIDPLLGPLADNGGPTFTHLPQLGSPALNAGDPAFDPNTFTPPLDNDQRGAGFPRVQEGRIEIGAVETAWIDLAIDKAVDDDKVNVGQIVEFTITLENLSTGTATNILIKDNLPAEMTYVSDTPSAGSYDSINDEWSVPSIGPLATETLLLYASVDAGTTPGLLLENTVEIISANEPDPNLQNNFALVRFTINAPPVAQCQNVSVTADGCEGNVEASEVDDGSFDPDGTIVDMFLTPAGPYPIGDTLVTLTVVDDDGATDTCPATITVEFSVRCELEPVFAENEVGTSHTVTVTVFVNDVPTSGVEVSFSIADGPNAGIYNATTTTDVNGQAGFGYLGTDPGLDTIVTTGTLCGVEFSCQAEKNWVISATPTPTPTPTFTPTPTPTPEPTPCNPAIYTFEGTDDGWLSGSADPILAPVTFGQTSTALTISGGDFFTFGFWLSPDAAIPSADPGLLYAVRYQLAWDGEACELPPLRLRALADNFEQMEVMGINSLGDCSYAVGPAPESFVLHFIPQAGGAQQDFRVALDMLNFDPGDSAAGTVTLESVDITCFPVAALDLTPVRTYTFEFDAEGWTSGTAALLSPPDFSHVPDALRMDSTSNVIGFGFWQSPVDDVTSLAGQAIVTTFDVEYDEVQVPGSVRVRMFNEDYQGYRYSEFPMAPLIEGIMAAGGFNALASYTSVWEPPFLAAPLDGIGLAFDLINFDFNSPENFGAQLDTAAVQTTDVPVLPPAPVPGE